MFCPNCGKELDANNVCINLACPTNSKPISESEKEASINNYSTINTVENNETPKEDTTNKESSGYKEISENDIHTHNNQNSSNTQNSNYNQNPNYNQNSGYNQNPNYNQNAGYNQNPNYNQNAGYNQNPNYNQNAGYNQNPNYNQNAGYNQNPNYGQNSGYNQGNPFTDRNGISANEMMDSLGPKNTEYYMDKWNRSQENPNFISWNWPAFFFGMIWLCFRKMYAIAGILFAVSFVAGIILPRWTQYLLGLIIMIVCGLLANQIYIKQSIDKIRSIKLTTGFNPQVLSQRLRATGGITWVPVIVALVLLGILIVFLIIVAIAAIAFESSYSNYGSFY